VHEVGVLGQLREWAVAAGIGVKLRDLDVGISLVQAADLFRAVAVFAVGLAGVFIASDYRGMARRALKNYWWLAVGVTLLASILGGTSSSFTPSFSLTINGDDLTQYYPEALRHALQVFLPVSGVISLCSSSSAAASPSATTASA